MADIATLGLSVESSQVKKGVADLDRLTVAAQRAEAATAGIGKTTSSTGKAVSAANSNWETYEETVARLGSKAKGSVAPTNAATAAVKAQSSAVQVAGQRAQVASVGFSAFASALGLVASIVGRFVMNALTVGIGILIAELAKLVDWSGLAVSALNFLADAVEAIGPYVIAVAATLALIYAPAIIGGIGTLIALMGVLSIAALRAAASFTVAWLAAIGPAGWFILGLGAVVAAANIFRDELTQIFGVDIVGAAKDGVNSIIGFFVGSYAAVVAAWGALPGAFGDLGYQAANKFIEGINWMVGEVVSIVNGLIAKINGGLRGAVGALGGDAANAVQLKDLGSPQGYKMGGFNNPYAGAAASSAGAEKAAFAAAQGVDYVGAGVGAISNAASGAADKIRELAAGLVNVGDESTKAGGKAGKAAKDATDPWKGLRGAVDKVSDGMKFARDVVGGFVSDMRNGLKNGESFWESFKKAASNAIDKIVDKLINNMLDALFQVNNAGSTGSGSGGGGGIFGTILGGIGKFLGFASGGYTGSGPATKAAGVVHGGEYVFSKRATDRIGVGALDQLHSKAKGYASGGYVSQAPRITPSANTNQRGAGSQDVVHVVLQDDSGRMAEIADQQFQTHSGTLVQVSVQQSVKAVKGQMSGLIANAQSRQM